MLIIGNSHVSAFDNGIRSADEDVRVLWVGALRACHFRQNHPSAQAVRREIALEKGWTFLFVGNHDFQRLWEDARRIGVEAAVEAALPDWIAMWTELARGGRRVAWVRTVGQPPPGCPDALVEVLKLEAEIADRLAPRLEALGVRILDAVADVRDELGRVDPRLLQADGLHLDPRHGGLVADVLASCAGVRLEVGEGAAGRRFDTTREEGSLGQLLCGRLGLPERALPTVESLAETIVEQVAAILRESGRTHPDLGPDTDLWKDRILDSFQLVRLWEQVHRDLGLSRGFEVDLRVTSTPRSIADLVLGARAGFPGFEDFVSSLEDRGTARSHAYRRIRKGGRHLLDRLEQAEAEALGADHPYGIVDAWKAACDPDPRRALLAEARARSVARPFPARLPATMVGAILHEAVEVARSSDPLRRNGLMQSGIDAMRELAESGDAANLVAVIAAWDEVIPDALDIQLVAARLAIALGLREEAEVRIGRAESIWSWNQETPLLRARLETMDGRVGEALGHLKEQMRRDPEVHGMRDALDALQRAVATGPNPPSSHRDRARAWIDAAVASQAWGRLERIAEAMGSRSRVEIEGLLEAPEIVRSGNPEILRAGAMILLRAGSLEAGSRMLESAIAQDPAFGPAHRDLGVSWILRGDLPRAESSLEAALALDSTDIAVLKALGHLRLLQGRREDGVASYAKALELAPNDQESWDVVDRWKLHSREPAGLSGITVIVYGRNDAHGQNLHKRAVISLNAIAEQLEPAKDEILFVDCNSPDDVPTFPEAILDLLTGRARSLLRILRIRPAQYARLAPGVGQPVFEALCRNVALRRCSPERHWVVSTNTDILLCPRGGKRLTEYVSELPEGFYGLPRFDVPQGLWQGLDRMDPVACMDAVREWADAFGLRFVAQRPETFIRWENPGDFQLALRKDMVGIGGFDESMVKGPYHIDSNFARRLSLLRGPVCSLEEWGECFHCDHSRQESSRFKEAAVEANDWGACVLAVGKASIAEAQPLWGGLGEVIEEVVPEAVARLEGALRRVVSGVSERFVLPPGGSGVQNLDVPLMRLVPFLADQILMLPSDAALGILGSGRDLVESLSDIRKGLGHSGPVLVSGLARCDVPGVVVSSVEAISEHAAMVVVDPGTRSEPVDVPLLRARFAGLCLRQMRLPAQDRARVLLLMAHFSWLGTCGRKWLHVNQAPTSTSLFFGRVRDADAMGSSDLSELVRSAESLPEEAQKTSESRSIDVSGAVSKVAEGIRGCRSRPSEDGVLSGPEPTTRILLDLRTLVDANSSSRGIGHYTLHLAKAILGIGGCRFGVLWDDRAGPAARPDLGDASVEWVPYTSYPSGSWDLVHVFDPMGNHPDYEDPFTLFSREKRITTTFYDLIPWHHYRERMGAMGWEVYLTRLEHLRAADATHLCISEFTAGDLVREVGIAPDRTEVVMAGLNAHHDPGRGEVEDRRIARDLGIQGPFCLYVGALDEHKNFMGVAEAWVRAASRIPGLKLVVVGRRNQIVDHIAKQFADMGLGGGVVFTGFVERWQLEALYRRAVATLFLSRFEGFGFPVLEAMAAGCPVVCSNKTSIPEVAGDAAIQCDPDDADGAAAALVRLHVDSTLRDERIRSGLRQAASFTWDKVARRVLARWAQELNRPPRRVALHRLAPARIEMVAPIYDPSGYASEARPVLQHLEDSGMPVRLIPIGRCSTVFREGAPSAFRKVVSDSVGRMPATEPGVRMIWFPGYAFRPDPAALRNVGRTTFETDSLPADWVEACNKMDEIWVPCAFNRETFARAGVRSPVLVVPEGVDTGRFRPGGDPLAIAGPKRGLTFLSVFEWTHRKGPDLLLAAWAKAFAAQDDVRLVIRTYPPNQIEGDPAAWVEDRIGEVLAALGTTRSRCAPIVVIGSQVPEEDMPRLYAAADVYLAPSRGEGWGRPHMEAMSCGVPVIATGWGGNLEFQNDDNSWLIRVDGLDVIDDREEFPGYKGQRWAAPSVDDFARLLAVAATDERERARKAERARTDMVERWDWSKIAPIAEVRLREILDGVPPEASALAGGYSGIVAGKGNGPGGMDIHWVGPLFNFSGYARFGREVVGALESEGARTSIDPQVNDPRWFEGLKGNPSAVARWKTLLGRRGGDGTLVVCDVPRSADGRSDLLAQVREAYSDARRKVVYTMFETDRLPTGWAETLNRMDQVWVPSRHNLRTFAAAGVDASKIRLVPCGLDPAPFEAVRGRPYPLPGRRAGTTFLSVFQWSRRKGWDVLLEAWAKAFTPDQDVRLVLRCHPMGGAPDVRAQVRTWLATRGLDLARMARVDFLDDFLPEDQVPSLYEAADVFVLPSRGEGWGLPYLEAMAAGKPCIGTAWGASGDFLHEGVGWMLPDRGVVPVGPEACAENPFLTPEHRWADIRVDDLVAAMRDAVASPVERRVRGDRARDEVRSRWNRECTAAAIREALADPVERTFPAPAVPRLLPSLRGRIPIAMPAYNRHAYLREVLEGLRGCRDLDKFCIVTGEEPGCPETRSLFDAVDWVPIVRSLHSERMGCNANVLGTIDRALELGDRFVSLEDDIVPGVDFLSFVRWGLDRFRDDASVFDVSGYQRHVDPPERADAGKVLSFDWFCPWGWASWRDRWERFRREVQVPLSGSASWDVFVCKWVVEEARLKELRPAVGRVQNIGEEGTWVPSAAWHRDNHRTPHWIGNLGWSPVPSEGFHRDGEPAGDLAERDVVRHAGGARLSGALAGVAAGLRAARPSRGGRPALEHAPDTVALDLPDASLPEGHISLRWEGSQFVHHSLAHVNRELCLGLAKAGQDLSIIPYEPDQFGPGSDPDLRILAQLTNAPLEGPCQVHVRHQWPPNLEAPPEGRWVVIQPWEFGSPPKAWMPAFRDRIDELWVPSRYCRDLYVRAGCDPDRVQVVPNGVDTDRFRPGLEPLASLPAKRGLRFLFVGGTIARKGFDRLLEAWERAFGPEDHVELLIKDMGGKTSYAGQTGEAKVRALQEAGRCAPIHYVNDDLHPDELPRLYASGDVLVHPYRGEGFGLPIAEAMACGLPVIITQGGAADDFCGDAEGWMIPAERKQIQGGKVGDWETVEPAWMLDPDLDALVAALRDAAAHPELRTVRGANARRRIAEGFTWAHATSRALERLRAIVARPVRRQASVVVPVPGPSLPSDDLSLRLLEIESAVGRQDFAEADRLSREAIEAHPHEALAWLMRGMVLRGQGKAGKALEALNHALTQGGGPEVRFEMMALHLQDGKVAPARAQWNVLKDKHGAWVDQRRRYHQEQGLPWLPDRLQSKAPKAPKRGKSPAPPSRRR